MSQPFHFEKSFSDLESIVEQLEKGELTLEESLKQFETGIQLARHCQKTLTEAEEKVKQLSKIQPSTPSSQDLNE